MLIQRAPATHALCRAHSTPLTANRPVATGSIRHARQACEPSTSGRTHERVSLHGRVAWPASSASQWRRPAKALTVTRAAEEGAEGAAPVYILPPVTDPKAEKEWLELQVREWLDEEWSAPTTVEIHKKLAAATAMAYIKARANNLNDMTDVLIALSSELSAGFNFFDTFTDAFEVSNKATELLMLRDGADVCCSHEADKARVRRVSEAFNAQRS